MPNTYGGTASGARRTIKYAKQSKFGVAGTTNPKYARTTGDSINITKTTQLSEELTGTPAVTFLRHGNESVGGDISFELAYGSFDDFFEAALRNNVWDDGVLVQDNTIPFFTIEKSFEDIKQHLTIQDCAVNTLSISMGLDSIVTGTIGIVGGEHKGFKDSATLTVAGGMPELVEPFNTFGATFNTDQSLCPVITGLDFTIDNGFTANYTLCGPTPKSLTPDKIVITGTITALFNDAVEISRFLEEEEFGITAELMDNLGEDDKDGNKIKFEFPRVKYTGGDLPTSGSGVISVSLPFQALYDDREGKKSTLIITKTDRETTGG